ncbi:MAG: M1 family metallopeptidase [Pyrinomonadaceae bacterium]
MNFQKGKRAAALLAAFFLTSGVNIFAQARPDFNRKQTYDVQHYLIRTNFDRPKFEVIGDTTITLKPLAANFRTAEFDQVALNFKKVMLDPSGVDLKFRIAGDKIIVTLDKAYGPNDTVSIRLQYTALKPKKGVYFVEPMLESGVERRSAQIWTQGEADEHRHWFPSFDFPSDKATSEQFITAQKGETVVANGELIEQKDNADNTSTWHYKMPIPHSSYLISFVIGKYAKVTEKYKEADLGYYVYPGTEAIVPLAYGNTKDMMRIFEELTGVPFPYNKYDQTVVASFNFGGMENITATTMADTEIYAARVDFIRGNIEDLVSHELAHSWFGDLVTCRNWAELWLNEGFATFMEAAYREKKYGRQDYLRMVAGDAEEFKLEDAVLPKNNGLFNLEAGNVAGLFDHSGVTYSKGGAVIHTLREQVGDANFWKAINTYLNRHKFGSVESTDLKKVMEETSGQDLGWFFDQWVYGIGSPHLTLVPVWNAGTKTLSLTVTQTQKPGRMVTQAFRLPTEIEFTVANESVVMPLEINKRSQVFTFKLTSKPTKINLDPNLKTPVKTVKVVPLI